MKVIAINGSPKKEGNTYHAIKIVADKLMEENIDVEIVHIGNKIIRGCTACNQCAKNRNEKCIIDDAVNETLQLIKEADGVILGSPTHYSAVAGTMKSFLDRLVYVAGNNNSMLRGKVGAAVVAVRRSGGVPTFDQLNNFLNYSEMVLATSNYWNVIHGTSPGEALQDAEGVQIMEVLGANMATLLKQMEATKDISSENKAVRKIYTNFIR